MIDPLSMVRGMLPPAETVAQADEILVKSQRKYKAGVVDTILTATEGDVNNGRKVAICGAEQMAESSLCNGFGPFPRFSLPSVPLDLFTNEDDLVFCEDFHDFYHTMPDLHYGQYRPLQLGDWRHWNTTEADNLWDADESVSSTESMPDLVPASVSSSEDESVESASSQPFDDWEVVT